MIIRCKGCQSTVWVRSIDSTGHSVFVVCRHCGQRYEFDGWTKKDLMDKRLGIGARNLARDEAIDLPGAYSVLLGIMTANEVRELLRSGRAPEPGNVAPDFDSDPDSSELPYDAAFKPSVDAGYLSARQAIERGARDAYAAVLANQHRLSRETSYQVADNRISLLDAIRTRNAANRIPLHVAAKSRRRSRTLVLLAVLAVLVITAAVLQNSQRTTPRGATVETSVGSAELLSDSQGRVLQVLAANPNTVLEAYCLAGAPGGRLTPVNVMAHESAGTRTRLGLLRDSAEPSAVLAITIREDRESNRWVAGDGKSPLIPEPAPTGAAVRANG